MGEGAMLANTTGSQNTAVGVSALRNNTTGFGNIAIGQDACSQSQGGQNNTGVGWEALLHNAGNFNTANGASALSSNTTGNDNTANGVDALSSNTLGDDNVASGLSALSSNTTGGGNVANGVNALLNNTTGSGNIALGANAGINVTNAENNICIGIGGENVSNVCYIGQTFGTVCLAGTPVFINGVGQLGTTTSSRRFKEEIKPMEHSSEAVFALKPVTFRYKKGIDPQGIPQFGLVAEEVEKVNPSLVVRDKDGKAYSVRYEAVNAMLLNEFLKEHQTVQQQGATIARLEKQIDALTAGLQKVSAQLELGKSAPQTVNNP
jgi:hypothetical protein